MLRGQGPEWENVLERREKLLYHKYLTSYANSGPKEKHEDSRTQR